MELSAVNGVSSARDTYADAASADAFQARLDAHASQAQQEAAPKKEEKSSHSDGGWLTRGLGLLQAGAGVVEMAGGVVGGVLTSETGIGAVAGGVVALHGVDDFQAGLRTAFSGKSTETFTQSAATGAAKSLGASPVVAAGIGLGVDFAAGGVAGGGEKAAIKGAEALEDGAKLFEDGAKAGKELNEANRVGEGLEDAGKLSKTGRTLKEVDVASGTKGNWSKELAHPEPDTIYHVDGDKTYVTDDLGRVKEAEGDLSLVKRDRNVKAQSAVGHSGDPGDQGGHLIASSLGGPGDKLNLVPQNGDLNNGAWNRLEDTWRKALQNGKPVHVSIENVYNGNSIRPESFNITYQIGNERPKQVVFANAPGGK